MQFKVKYKYKIWYIFLCCSLWAQYNPCHQSNNMICYTQHLSHNQRDGVSNHQRIDCLLKCLFRRRSKKTSKFCVIYFARGIHRWSLHKGPVTRKMFPFDNVIMLFVYLHSSRLIIVTSIYSKSKKIRTLFLQFQVFSWLECSWFKSYLLGLLHWHSVRLAKWLPQCPLSNLKMIEQYG